MGTFFHAVQFLLFWGAIGLIGLFVVRGVLWLLGARMRRSAGKKEVAVEPRFRHISEIDLPIGTFDPEFDFYASQRDIPAEHIAEPIVTGWSTKEIKTIDDFYTEVEKYVEQFNSFVEKHGLVGKVVADHICYKCVSSESFEHIRALFEHESHYMHQSIISNRRIVYIRLARGIETSLGEICFLELSDQKQDNSQTEGFDHIEAYPVGYSYEEMVSDLEQSERVIKVERPHHTTHDIDIGGTFLFRCTQGPLIDKIKYSEMN